MTEYAALQVSVDSRDLDKATRGLDDLGRSAASAEKSAIASGRNIGLAFAGIAIAAGTAFAGILSATKESELAFSQLEQGVKNAGDGLGRTLAQLQAEAERLQSITLFDDDQIALAQARLTSFLSVTGDVFDRAIVASTNLAQRMGGDLAGAALQVGKALEDPIRGMTALSRSGTTFTESQREMIKQLAESGKLLEAQGVILGVLEDQYKGSAEAARNTFSGALVGMKNALGNLLEAGNGESLEDARVSIEELTAVISSPEFKEGAAAIVNGFINIAAAGAKLVAEGVSIIEFLNELENAFIWKKQSDSVAGIEIRIDSLSKKLEGLRNQERVFGEGTQSVVIAQVEAEISALEAQQNKLLDVQSKQIAQDTAAAPVIKAKTAAIQAEGDITEDTAKQLKKLNDERERERQAIQAIVDATNPYQAKQRELIAQIAVLDQAITKERGSTEDLTKAKAVLTKQLSDLQSTTRDTIREHEKSVESLTAELAAVREGEDAYRKFTVEQKISEESRARILELQKSGIELTDEEAKRIEALTRQQIELIDQIDREKEAREKANEAWESFITEIAGAFFSATGNIGDAFTDLLGRLERELINSGIASVFGLASGDTPILSGIGQLIKGGGGFGLDTAFSAGKFLPGLQSNVFSGLGNLAMKPGLLGDIGLFGSNAAGSLAKLPGGLVGGGLISAGSGFLGGQLGASVFGGEAGLGSAAGGIGGALLGAQFGSLGGPLGAFVGAFAGSALDKVLGGDGPETRAAVFAGTDVSRAEQKHTVATLTGASGLTLAGEAQRVGEEGAEAVRTMTQALADLDTQLTAVTRGAGFNVDLSGAKFGGGQFATGGDAARQFVQTWIDEVSRGFGDELEMAAATLGGESAIQLAAGFESLLKINDQLARGGTIFDGITTLSETLGLLQGKFAESGEGLSDTLTRLNTASALLIAIGEDSQNTVEYFERASNALRGLGANRAADITAYGNSLQNINNLLSSDIALKNYEESTRSLYETYQAQTQQIEQLSETLNSAADFGNLEAALVARYNTELQLIGQIESALLATQKSFDSTIQSIFIDGLKTEQDRYEYFRQQADSVAEQVLSLTDPAQIQAAVSEYNQLVSQAYQALGDESKDLLRDDIIATVQEMRDLTTGMLEELKQDVAGGGEDIGAVIRSETQQALQQLRQAVQDAVNAVAQQQQETSRQSSQLVSSLNGWAASLPSSIVVQITGSETAF